MARHKNGQGMKCFSTETEVNDVNAKMWLTQKCWLPWSNSKIYIKNAYKRWIAKTAFFFIHLLIDVDKKIKWIFIEEKIGTHP